jgi:hypothetical protein
MSQKSSEQIRKALSYASRAPRVELYEHINELILQLETGKIAEFKVVSTGRGIDVFVTDKDRFE